MFTAYPDSDSSTRVCCFNCAYPFYCAMKEIGLNEFTAVNYCDRGYPKELVKSDYDQWETYTALDAIRQDNN